jgi:hypothetical protein
VQQLVGEYTAQRRLASQYSRNGNYTICWSEVEILPDGRIIDGDRIFGGYVDDPESNSDEGNIEDSFYPDHCGTKTFPSSYVDPGSW